MVKQKKKRNKRYTGEDSTSANSSQPKVTRVQAVDRGRFGQWWFERKKQVRIGAIASAVIAFVGWLIFELFRIVL